MEKKLSGPHKHADCVVVCVSPAVGDSIHVGQCGVGQRGVHRGAAQGTRTAVDGGDGDGRRTNCSRKSQSGLIENARGWLPREESERVMASSDGSVG